MENQTGANIAPIEQMVARLGADAVFGKPTTEGDATIIPVAQVEYGFGYGGGYGSAPKREADGEGSEGGEGGGSGAAGGGRATPRGYIRITPQEVKYQPIIDETRIPLAGILMGAWSVFWIMATVRTIAKVIGKRRQRKA
jgi:uncharacterized spore protein YtfJ